MAKRKSKKSRRKPSEPVLTTEELVAFITKQDSFPCPKEGCKSDWANTGPDPKKPELVFEVGGLEDVSYAHLHTQAHACTCTKCGTSVKILPRLGLGGEPLLDDPGLPKDRMDDTAEARLFVEAIIQFGNFNNPHKILALLEVPDTGHRDRPDYSALRRDEPGKAAWNPEVKVKKKRTRRGEGEKVRRDKAGQRLFERGLRGQKGDRFRPDR